MEAGVLSNTALRRGVGQGPRRGGAREISQRVRMRVSEQGEGGRGGCLFLFLIANARELHATEPAVIRCGACAALLANTPFASQ
jgi:hypothetical protein